MNKANHATPRESIRDFQEIVNVGPAVAEDFRVLGLDRPAQLVGKDPLALYSELTQRTGIRQDPCVLDVFIATTDFMNGNPPRAWWEFTEYRKRTYGDQVRKLLDEHVQTVDARARR